MPEKPVPARYLRECGHPADQTLDLLGLDNVIRSYCLGCIIERLQLPVVAQHIVKDGKLIRIDNLERRKLTKR